MKLIDGHDVIEHAEVNGEDREFIRILMDYIEDADTVEPTIEIDADQLAKLLREGWTIHSETKQGEWIPCSERLPEEHEWIGTKKFGTTISDKVHITFDVNGERFVKTLSLQNGELSNSDKQRMDAFYKGWKMVAWMPLPPAWKGADIE